jgi:hypothetical protein
MHIRTPTHRERWLNSLARSLDSLIVGRTMARYYGGDLAAVSQITFFEYTLMRAVYRLDYWRNCLITRQWQYILGFRTRRRTIIKQAIIRYFEMVGEQNSHGGPFFL